MPAITIPGGASTPELKAHLATPPVAAPPWPGVVVLHESFGLNDDIRQQADRLAAAGYLAVALDLYSAGGAIRCIRSVFRAQMRGTGDAFEDILGRTRADSALDLAVVRGIDSHVDRELPKAHSDLLSPVSEQLPECVHSLPLVGRYGARPMMRG